MASGFYYQGGILRGDEIALPELAALYPTPFYCYSRQKIIANYQRFDKALAAAGIEQRQICYSIKANGALAIINTLAQAGAGADIVSGGELVRALRGGISADKIVFSGVGKTAEEIRAGFAATIARFNVESLDEIDMIAALARDRGKVAKLAVRINPDIEAGGHTKISTGKAEDKFGIAYENAVAAYAHIAALDGVEAQGIDIHIGSQILDLTPFRHAFARVRDLLTTLRSAGHNITHLDLGGGLGVPDETDSPPLDITAYANLIAETFKDCAPQGQCHITLEPGRALVADAGVLITRVIRTKKSAPNQKSTKNFMIVDASMAELIRPTLYDAYHHIAPLTEPEKETPIYQWDIVGAICESGDILGLGRTLPAMPADTPLAIFHCGAYASVLASHYNARPHIAEVMIDKDTHQIIRPRQTYDELLAGETIPDWNQ
ncbi:MAG: diaminopimelate decarboxylase [Alphaproteobacteria bacterium]|nr:diaminopimelate decarboxylase [Alphaproteobacteria bacterium]